MTYDQLRVTYQSTEQMARDLFAQVAAMCKNNSTIGDSMTEEQKRRAEDAARQAAQELKWESQAAPGFFGISVAAPAVDAAQALPAELDKLKALAVAATPGPWDFDTEATPFRIEGGEVVGGDCTGFGDIYTAYDWPLPEGCEDLQAEPRTLATGVSIADGRFIRAANPAAILRIAALVAQHETDLDAYERLCQSKDAHVAQQAARIAELEARAEQAKVTLLVAHDVLSSMGDSDLDHFEDDEEERDCAPVQYAARKIWEVIATKEGK